MKYLSGRISLVWALVRWRFRCWFKPTVDCPTCGGPAVACVNLCGYQCLESKEFIPYFPTWIHGLPKTSLLLGGDQ